MGPGLLSAHTRKRGARRPGDVVLRHGGPPVAARSDLYRPTLVGLNRLHAARGSRGRGCASGPPYGAVDRRRGRTIDRAGTRHVLPRRAVPGHRGGQQRWLHGRTGHPRRDGPVQRHRELELDRASQRAGCDQSPRVPCPNLWPTRRRPHRRRGTAGPDGARRGGVAAARDPRLLGQLVGSMAPQ